MSGEERIEVEEKERLRHCLERIHEVLGGIDERLGDQAEEVRTRKEYMWDARRDMDHIEKIAVRQAIEQTLDSAEALAQWRIRLLKLLDAPYFGRIDFRAEGAPEAAPVYIGVHHFRDDEARETLVHDWRSPIASMFYDHEPGEARYEAPAGMIEGQLLRKRQFRIRGGELEFAIESGIQIVDDVLQETLSDASSDEGMRNIVATIQRDQNAIIRDDDAHTLVIQGVAGSGKTSIALHRIAYLLYRHKDTLSSDDILILSPNRVFADYIGNVLPELGEEQVAEVSMEDLATELLDGDHRFESFFEQTDRLLDKRDPEHEARVAAKATPEFLESIDRYVGELEQRSFRAVDWRTGRKIVPAWFLEETWRKHRRAPFTERLAHVVRETEVQIGIHYNYELRTDERRALREAVRGMAERITLRRAYQGLFEWLGRPELFRTRKGRLEYADVFPLIHLKMRLEGIRSPRPGVKHLLIDEMQDYTPVQYAVLGRLFSCRKTVLGDVHQSVDPQVASSVEGIRAALRSAIGVRLTKSFRSTWEIMQFALRIRPDPQLEPMARHGDPPRVEQFSRRAGMLAAIGEEIAAFHESGHRSLAVLVRSSRGARRLHADLARAGIDARLLGGDSGSFSTGVVVCTAYLAKGLEFDRVVVPEVDADSYRTDMDRNLLYIACTRAMHRLALFAVGELSPLLSADPEGAVEAAEATG